MDRIVQYKVGDFVKNECGDIGRVDSIVVEACYGIQGIDEEDGRSWYVFQAHGFGNHGRGNIERRNNRSSKVITKPKYYKYIHTPCPGCVFLHKNEEGKTEEWLVEAADKEETNHGSGSMGAPTNIWTKRTYRCKNLLTGEKRIFDEDYLFTVIRKLKVVFA